MKILYLCAVRRGELFIFKWKDLQQENGMWILMVERSFCSATYKVKEWSGKVAGMVKMPAKVAVPPGLAREINGWKKFGLTNAGNPESFIFPTRKGNCIIPTNWQKTC